MKILKVFSLVVVLHLVLLVMLVVQPGCGTVSKTETAKAATPVGDSRYSDLWVMNKSDSKKDNRITKNAPAKVAADRVSSSVAYSESDNNETFIDIQEARVQTAAVYSDDNNHGEYTVEKGDSLWNIARKNNISMRTLMSYNGLTETDRIYPGQTLMVPGGNTLVAANQQSNEPVFKEAPAKADVIAKNDPVVMEPREAEEASTEVAEVEISKPKYEPEEIEGIYEVQPGDSLYILALRNNTTIEEIRRLNHLDKYMIRVGQKIMIPGYNTNSEPMMSVEKQSFATAFNDVPVKQTGAPDVEYLEHEVQPGEFPGLIARKYNMSVAQLMSLNKIQNPRALRVGTTLKVTNPEFLNQTQMAGMSNTSDNESMTVKVDSPEKATEEETSVSTINFEDFPIVRVGS